MPSSKVSPSLQINLLGKYYLSVNGTSISDIQSERLQALLAFLLLHRDMPQSRQQLAVQLWPEISEANAKANLRRRLHELKQKLPTDQNWLQIEKKTIRWRPEARYWLDVAAFETAISDAYAPTYRAETPGAVDVKALEEAAKLYRGDLLPECYDDWIVPYRDNLRNQAMTALDALISQLIEQHQIRAALSYAQQLQRLDPLHEPAYCHLMRLHALEGDRASALRVYHQCMTVLQEELGVPPSPSTSSLYEELLTLEDTPQAVAQFAASIAPPTETLRFELEVPGWETAAPDVASSLLPDVEESQPGADLTPRSQKTASPPTVNLSLETVANEAVVTAEGGSQPIVPLTDDGSLAVAEEALPATQVDWGEAPDIRFFYGRSTEINLLKGWVTLDRSRLIVLLGMGGIGKTTLAAKVAQEVQGEFDYLIWRSLRNAPPLETLLTDLIPFLSHQQDTACSVARLMHWLRQSRCLVVLDNCETILKEGERAGQFRAGYENYGDLMQVIGQGNHQSCLMLTSREKPAEISTFEGIDLTVRSLQIKGSREAALAMLDVRQLRGTPAQKEQLGERYGYSPLALQIVGGSIRDMFSGDISLFLEEDTLLFNGAKKLLDLQFARLSPLEKTVMVWLAINREWTSISELMADIYPRCAKRRLMETLESLCWRSLIDRRGNTYTQQPVVMEYITLCLIEAVSEELTDPEYFDAGKDDGTALPHLAAYALIKATVQDFIRASQGRLIVQPILEQVIGQDTTPTAITLAIRTLLPIIRRDDVYRTSYAGGNLLNLCCQAQLQTSDLDFSQLTLRQVYLQGATLHQLDVSGAEFVRSVFTQAFGSALSIAYSPDGTLLAMGDNNYNVQLWRATDGQPLMTLQGHKGWVWSIAFSPDGSTLVSGSVDYTVRLWDVASGRCLHTLQEHSSVVWGVAFSPDGQTVASGSEDQTAKVWDVKTGACLQTLESPGGLVRSLVFHPNRTELATAHADTAVRWWNLETGDCVQVWRGHQAPVWAIALHPKGQMLASAGADQTICLWDIETGQCTNTLVAHTNQIWSIAFSPNGYLLASGSHDRTVRLWDVQTQSCLATLLGHTDQIWSVGFSPDSRMIASGGFDQTIRLWDVSTHQCLQTLHGYTNCVRSLAFIDDGMTLISGGDDALIRRWHIRTGECLQTLDGHRSGVWAVAHLPSSSSDQRSRLATGGFDQTIRLWDATTGQSLQTLDGQAGWIHGIAFHPDGKRLASGSIQPVVRIWDLTTGECCQQLPGHTNQVWTLAFSPNGQYLASAGADRLIKIWDVDSGDYVQTLADHTDWMYAVAFGPPRDAAPVKGLPESWLASSSGDRTIKLWDVDTGECFRTLTGHTGWVYAMTIHPQGHLILSASHDHTARVWDIQTGECLHVLNHAAPLWSMAVHPQEHLMACSGEDEQITLWDIESGEKVSTFHILKPYAGMRISNVTGLSDAQKSALKALGALE